MLKGLIELGDKATKSVETFTFSIKDVEVKVAGTGNVAYRAKLNDGTTVTFWKSNMDDVIEETGVADILRLKVGVQISNNADRGLIPADKVGTGSFWK